MKYVWGTVLALLALILGAFMIQNLALIDVNFFRWSLSMPKAIVILSSYLTGVITGSAIFALVSAYFKSA